MEVQGISVPAFRVDFCGNSIFNTIYGHEICIDSYTLVLQDNICKVSLFLTLKAAVTFQTYLK